MRSSGPDLHIPVIDISTANPDAPQQLLDAACRFGFVFIANNQAGISPDLIAALFDLSKDFFALPIGIKQAVSIGSNKAGENHGWLGQGVENLDPHSQQRPDVKEAFNMGVPLGEGPHQPLPETIRQNLATVIAFQDACHDLCQRILTAFAIALRIDPDWFTSRHDMTKGTSGSVLRLLYYPKATTTTQVDDVDIRAGAHSDYGSITCLFQLPGQPGLEIKTPDGQWAAVPVDPLASASTDNLPILINIGDLLEDWTAELLKSTVHRVVFPKQDAGDRYSMAYFCHPLDDALLEPVPSEVVREYAERHGDDAPAAEGKPVTAHDHLMARLAATYRVK